MKKGLYSAVCLLIAAAGLLAAGVWSVGAQTTACAAGEKPLVGWAWSDNIGHISFNSTNAGSGGGPHQVCVNSTTGAMVGYAWSDSLGWISFGNAGDLSGCPGSFVPTVNFTSGEVRGSARVLTGKQGAPGWDGCIELSGTNHASPVLSGNGGVTYDPATGIFSGFAWAPLLGWISFNSNLNVDKPHCVGGGCGDGSTLTGSCTATSVTNANGSVTGTYTATASGGSAPYLYSWDGGATFGSTNPASFTYTTSGRPLLKIKDNKNALADPAPQCPTVTAGSAGGELTLYLDKTSALAASKMTKSLRVKVGNAFGLAVTNRLPEYNNSGEVPTGYQCVHSITPAPTKSDSTWLGVLGGIKQHGGNGDNILAGEVGQFLFKIVCTPSPSGPPISAEATLRVTSTDEGEI